MSSEDLEQLISSARKCGNRFFILLGGEPFLYKDLGSILRRYSDCYFQIITNGLLITPERAREIRQAGNATILISLDGFQEANDHRRGQGVFQQAALNMQILGRAGIPLGVATTITSANVQEVLSESYIRWVDRQGALYLWYYIYRPVGPNPTPELALTRDQLVEVRKRLLALRKKSPILLIDTYWDAFGRAVCPAALGLGYHIGPAGDIELCPPLSFAVENIRDANGDLFGTINGSRFLRDFRVFATERTRGCVILERPQELVEYLRQHAARDTSGRDAYAELAGLTPRPSHHVPEAELPENHWLYRWLKRHLFFGLGAYG